MKKEYGWKIVDSTQNQELYHSTDKFSCFGSACKDMKKIMRTIKKYKILELNCPNSKISYIVYEI